MIDAVQLFEQQAEEERILRAPQVIQGVVLSPWMVFRIRMRSIHRFVKVLSETIAAIRFASGRPCTVLPIRSESYRDRA